MIQNVLELCYIIIVIIIIIIIIIIFFHCSFYESRIETICFLLG